MRILIVMLDNIARVGGKKTHVMQLTDGLEKLGHKVKVLSSGNIPALQGVFINGSYILFNKIWLGLGTVYFLTMRGKCLSHLIRKTMNSGFIPDVINLHDPFCIPSLRKLNLDIPIVLTVHGDATNEHLSGGTIAKNTFGERFLLEREIEACDYSDLIVTVDTRLRNRILGFSEKYQHKTKVVFNAVNTDEFREARPAEQDELRVELGFDQEAFIVFCPRRLVKKNGVIFPLMALNQLVKQQPEMNILLIYAGDGPELEAMLNYINEHKLHDYVRLLGNVEHSQIFKYYLLSDVIIIPSVTSEGVQEATSISALEGMSCGKPIIVSGIGGLKELVVNEKTGLVVEEQNPEEIAFAITKLMRNSDLQQNLGRNARGYVLENHSHLSHARQLARLYESVLGV